MCIPTTKLIHFNHPSQCWWVVWWFQYTITQPNKISIDKNIFHISIESMMQYKKYQLTKTVFIFPLKSWCSGKTINWQKYIYFFYQLKFLTTDCKQIKHTSEIAEVFESSVIQVNKITWVFWFLSQEYPNNKTNSLQSPMSVLVGCVGLSVHFTVHQ